jgi:D-alanyl-lipoteichoic acid acyltransferase DltB (MBOAT superfamily)
VYARPLSFSGLEVLLAVYGYALQIFCDFSGYTDMAIGLAAVLGYKLCDNFHSPYQAADITDFWRRWHISLSSWLRDYVYIPLGGNRHGKNRQYLNQFLTMLIGGLWHGANVRFILWGGAHGLALVGHKMWQNTRVAKSLSGQTWVKWVGGILTFHLVAALWILFRAPSVKIADYIAYQILYHANFYAYVQPFWAARPLLVVVLFGGFFLVFLNRKIKDRIRQLFIASPWLVKIASLLIVIQLCLEMGTQGVQPFIYFQF